MMQLILKDLQFATPEIILKVNDLYYRRSNLFIWKTKQNKQTKTQQRLKNNK